MNKRIDFTNLGGFPFTQATFDFMQTSYREAFKAIAKLCGDKVIVTGVTVVGSVVSDGWIVVNGELIPFVGGAIGANVAISETVPGTQEVFEDGTERDVYYTKQATIGTPGNFPITDLVRLNTLQEMWLPKDVKEIDCEAGYIAANFDMVPGSPTLGLGKNERLGWAICNGVNGTRNRGGRVSVGYSTVAVDPVDGVWDVLYNTIGGTTGTKSFVITEDNIEEFYISKPGSSGTGGIGNPVAGNSSDDGNITYTVGVPNPTPIDRRGPLIVSLFIQRL